jgi:hypothetical protein
MCLTFYTKASPIKEVGTHDIGILNWIWLFSQKVMLSPARKPDKKMAGINGRLEMKGNILLLMVAFLVSAGQSTTSFQKV